MRQALDLRDQLSQARGRELASQLGQAQRQHVHDRHLAEERLGGRHPDLQARARVQHAVRVARGLRAHHVGDRQHARAALVREAHRRERVRRLADCVIPSTRSPAPTTGLR